MKALLLEDESLLRKNIAAFLRKKGFIVTAFEDGKTLLESANLHDFDVFILDVNVPDVNGFEILEFIKNSDTKTPAIIISAYTDPKDILCGFKLGCADYLKKPFDLEELEVRILKATGNLVQNVIKINEKYSYDLKHRELTENGKVVSLPKTLDKLFYFLAKQRGGIVRREEIMEYLYPDGMTNINTLTGRIRDLRNIVDAEIVKNVHGVGYRLNVDGAKKS